MFVWCQQCIPTMDIKLYSFFAFALTKIWYSLWLTEKGGLKKLGQGVRQIALHINTKGASNWNRIACLHVFTVVKDYQDEELQQCVRSWSRTKFQHHCLQIYIAHHRASNHFFFNFVLLPVHNDLDCRSRSSSSTLAPKSLSSKNKL